MKNEKHIPEELKEISPLLIEIDKAEVYSVPSFYFTNLSEEIVDRITEIKERAYFFGSFTPYYIPENYFNNLPEIILQKVREPQKKSEDVFEEMENLAPLLNTISKNPLLSVPVNYFDNIRLPSAAPYQQKAKVIEIKRRSTFSRIAAAAVIIPFLAVGVYIITGREGIRSNTSRVKSVVKNLSKAEIVNYLKKSTSTENTSSASQKTSANDNELKSSLRQISDKEIQQFLKETGESDEI